MLDLLDPNVFIGSLSNIYRNVFVLCRVAVEKSEQKDRTMGFITIPMVLVIYCGSVYEKDCGFGLRSVYKHGISSSRK